MTRVQTWAPDTHCFWYSAPRNWSWNGFKHILTSKAWRPPSEALPPSKFSMCSKHRAETSLQFLQSTLPWKVNTSAEFCPHQIVLPHSPFCFSWWFFDSHHWTDQVRNPSVATPKITVQEQKWVSLHWPRDWTGDLFRSPFCDWVMTMSHMELETWFSLPE